ncbi:hypothetical protein HMPREF0980_02795 [Dorea sp. D27]|nr:hypothetical protein HMPREF0980_02795 [Dorea sp. D27]
MMAKGGGINFMKKHVTISILMFLLLISLAINIFQYVSSREYSDDIVGTYCTGDGRDEEDEYLTFTKDGSYCLYRQSKILEEGTYTEAGENIFTLNDSDTSIISADRKIYRPDASFEVISYAKISDTPVRINIP